MSLTCEVKYMITAATINVIEGHLLAAKNIWDAILYQKNKENFADNYT